MADSVAQLEEVLVVGILGILRAESIAAEDVRALQIVPSPGFDRFDLQWQPLWCQLPGHTDPWKTFGKVPIPGLIHEIAAQEAVLEQFPHSFKSFTMAVETRVLQFMNDLRGATRRIACNPLFFNKRGLTGFFIARPSPPHGSRYRLDLTAFSGPPGARGLFPVRNLHDLGPGKRKARRYGWCQYYGDGLLLALPEGERCSQSPTQRNPASFFIPFKSMTSFSISESEIRFAAPKETILVPGHLDDIERYSREMNEIAGLLGKPPVDLRAPLAVPAPAPNAPVRTPEKNATRDFLRTLIERIDAVGKELPRSHPKFEIGSIIVNIDAGRAQLILNPPCHYLAAPYRLDGHIDVHWNTETLFPSLEEYNAVIDLLHGPVLHQAMIQEVLDAMEELSWVRECSYGRVRLGSDRWGIAGVLFRKKSPRNRPHGSRH